MLLCKEKLDTAPTNRYRWEGTMRCWLECHTQFPTPVILNAYSVSAGLVNAQYSIEEKSCELNEL